MALTLEMHRAQGPSQFGAGGTVQCAQAPRLYIKMALGLRCIATFYRAMSRAILASSSHLMTMQVRNWTAAAILLLTLPTFAFITCEIYSQLTASRSVRSTAVKRA